MIRISYTSPTTGERVVNDDLTEDQARDLWNAMSQPLRETAVIEEVE